MFGMPVGMMGGKRNPTKKIEEMKLRFKTQFW
jgi:hypothetical protein